MRCLSFIIIEVKVRFGPKMKEEAQRSSKSQKKVACPQCSQEMDCSGIKRHILACKKYVPTYVNNVRRFVQQMSPTYLEFLIQEMDIIKEQLTKKVQAKYLLEDIKEEYFNSSQPKHKDKEIPAENRQEKRVETKVEVPPPQPKEEKSQSRSGRRPVIEPTMVLQDLYGPNDPFKDEPQDRQTIECANPACTMPAKANDIQKFTYLDECLHTICNYCFRNYIRNNYVKKNGQLKCPGKKCKANIPYFQIKQIMDPTVFNKLEEELNSSAFDLIQCQKCKEQYQFQKGKSSDAPKKTAEGNTITASMAKHYSENRFHCPKCKQEQCKSCKEVPYHLGFDCQDFKQHKLKKYQLPRYRKCRYCRKVLPKGYMSESGIHTFDDICDSADCSLQMKEACSKRLECGHSCFGVIKEKKCPPCLKQECALKIVDKLHGNNENSFCSLCYIESLGEAPCIQSKCGHIFHLKCLKKRLELKWGSPRITFRFCECPLCNQWIQVPEECSLFKELQRYKTLSEKIRQKALKRLKYENEDKDPKLTEPKSPFFNNQEKYAVTIYAYFLCYECEEPYFGGRKSCAEAMNEALEGQKFDPKELICPSCCPVQVTDCKKHGKEFISFKCRFCCSVAQWFCWGNTHFCDECHKKQISGEYISRIPKDKLPKCLGKSKCPVGGQHGGNGDQFCLGCGVCRGDKISMQDF